MSFEDSHVHAKFGIEEIYFHKGFTASLLEKLHQRAVFTLDAEDTIVKKHVTNDMILIFQKQAPSQSLIYRFLQHLDQDADRENFIKFNTLTDEDELFSAAKSKKYILVTHRNLMR
jgi:hypothetical protein